MARRILQLISHPPSVQHFSQISSWNVQQKIFFSSCFNVIYWVENLYFPVRFFPPLSWLPSCLHPQRNMQKSSNAFWNMSGKIQMITHEILRNYCNSPLFLLSWNVCFFFIHNISSAEFACVEQTKRYAYAMNDKTNFFRIANIRTADDSRHVKELNDVLCRRFNIIKICFIIRGLQINCS